MISLNGYIILEEIYKSSKTLIYKAIRKEDNSNVMIKILRKEYPNPEELNKFRHEYEIVKKLKNIKGIIKNHSLINYKNSLAIIMEFMNGNSLSNLIRLNMIDIKLFLIISIQLANIIGEIHKKNIIHKDIKPANIIVNLKNNEVKIIDFSISTELLREKQSIITPDHLEGTLAYISPEQTGRMNRSIDYRSDYYSLGITFYEMITGILPFRSNDPMELVYSHIAKEPKSPNELNNKIPRVISDIIMKLISKTAEERYKSTEGIKYDLEKCLSQLNKKNKIRNFEIAKKDISKKFTIPQKLYGRDKDYNKLINVFEKTVIGNKKILLIKGASGIGKSALISEIQKHVLDKNAYYIQGKYDQFNNNSPYTAIIDAFNMLIKYLLIENKELIIDWKLKFFNFIGNNGKILENFIPDINLIIEEQVDIQTLSAIESKNRFNYTICNFIQTFSEINRPIVIFLDDLQWADNASLELLNIILNNQEIKKIMFIGAYRNDTKNKLSYTDLINVLNLINLSYHEINLNPLNINDINELLSDILNINKEETISLSKIIYNKTNGYPFFILEFLKNLYLREIIYFENQWKWNLEKIKNEDITDNVVKLMENKINKLQPISFDIIKLAACIGIEFYFKDISFILDKDEEFINKNLNTLIREGIIQKEKNKAKFSHDKIHEAIYSGISNNEKELLHYKIGKSILEKYKNNIPDNKIFFIVNHMNISKKLLNKKELKLLINFNYKAGVLAKKSSAYNESTKYLNNAKLLLHKNSWENNYKKTLKIYNELAESTYLARNYDSAKKLFNIIINNSKDILDKVKIENIIIDYYSTSLNIDAAIKNGLKVLKELGYNLKNPKFISPIDVLIKIIDFKLNPLIRKKRYEDILKIKNNKDERKNTILDIMQKISYISFLKYTNAYVYTCFELVMKSFKYGLTRFFPMALTSAGSILSVLNQFEIGNKLGEVSLKVMKRFNYKPQMTMQYFVCGAMIFYWKKHIRKTIMFLKDAYKIGLESGNLQWASYSLTHYCLQIVLIGTSLEEVKEIFDKYTGQYKILKQEDANTYFYPAKQYIYNLLGHVKNKYKLIGSHFDEDSEIKRLEERKYGTGLSIVYLFKIMLLFILSDYEEAYEISKKSENFLKINVGQFQNTHLSFFIHLSYLQMINNISKKEKPKLLKKIINFQKKIKKWSESCPDNFSHMYYLITAEIARINVKNDEAMKYYDLAIKSAKKYEYINIEAISNELAAHFYKSIGMNRIFQTYMIEACYSYIKWGANSKINELEKQHPDIFESLYNIETTAQDILKKTYSTISKSTKRKSSSSNTSNSLDIYSVLKASQAISSEIELENLLKKLITILMENAGAQKGILLMKRNDKLFIEAEKTSTNKKAILLKSISLEEGKKISNAIINYVERTNKVISLDDATKDPIFANDEYIKKYKPKSVLCIPIIHQNNLLGILYLENNIITNAFTKNHQEVLKILSSQAAISIQNVFLYENLKDQELLKKEMKLASTIQMSMLPEILPLIKGYDIDAACIMAKEAGGDLYDIVPLSNTKYLLVIGDVSGKGMPAALYMSSTINMIRTLVESSKINQKKIISPGQIIKLLNKLLKNVMKRGKFVTLFLGILDNLNNIFTFTSSGHDPVCIYNPISKKLQKITTKGQACGIVPSSLFDNYIEEKKVKINEGDYYIFYTDGVTETKNKYNDIYMHDFFTNLKNIKNNMKSKDVVANILQGINEFKKDTAQYDDITILCLKKNNSTEN